MGFFKIKNGQQQTQAKNTDSIEGYDRVRQQIAEKENAKDNGKTIEQMQAEEQNDNKSFADNIKARISRRTQQEPEPVNEYVEEPEQVQVQTPAIEKIPAQQEDNSNQLYSAQDVLKMLKSNKELEVKERLLMVRNILNEVLGDLKK